MSDERPTNRKEPTDPSLGRIVMDDLRATKFQRDYLEEFKDLYYFYLDEDSRDRLAGKGRIQRAFILLAWLVKSLLTKLSPARRLLLVIAAAITMFGDSGFALGQVRIGADLRPIGFLILLLVLMLELKDKLLARDEIQIARQVQLALLPQSHPDLPGWVVWSQSRPANDVGGDLVDYIELDGFRHGIVLGDVAGKGLGAALLTSKLQATLSAIVADAPSLDDLGSRLNTILHRDGLDNRYATLFYAELEHDSGQVRYLNAGHNPAYVLRPDEISKLGASSVPLGMLPGTSYREDTLRLDPGDMLFIYSDGLTEATNAAGEEFGTRRLEELLPGLRESEPVEVGRQINAVIDAFLGDVRASDDLSIVIVRKT